MQQCLTLDGRAVLRVRVLRVAGGALRWPAPARNGCCNSLVAFGRSFGTLHLTEHCEQRFEHSLL